MGGRPHVGRTCTTCRLILPLGLIVVILKSESTLKGFEMATSPYVQSSINDALSLFGSDEADEHRACSIRIGLQQLAVIDSMASHAKVSRQRMISKLLRVGTAVVLEKLPPDQTREIDDLIVDRYETLLDLGGDASC